MPFGEGSPVSRSACRPLEDLPAGNRSFRARLGGGGVLPGLGGMLGVAMAYGPGGAPRQAPGTARPPAILQAPVARPIAAAQAPAAPPAAVQPAAAPVAMPAPAVVHPAVAAPR